MRRVLALVTVLVAFVVIACSDDDGGAQGATPADAASAGDTDAVCEYIREEQALEEAYDFASPGNARTMEVAQALSPPELAAQFATMVEFFEALADLDPDDPTAVDQAEELLADPEVTAATEAIQALMIEECGTTDDTAEASGPSPLDSYVDTRYQDEELNRDLFDGQGIPEGYFDGWIDPAHLDLWLDEHHEDVAWRERRASRSSGPGRLALTAEFTVEEALEACETLLEYVTEVGIDTEIVLRDQAGEPLADNTTGTCLAP